MIQIIDYGIGNLRSIEKAVEHVGAKVVRSDNIEDITRADRIILPGVGAFGACVDELRRRGLERPILDAVAEGKPFLGVCVGLQMLFDGSDEMGTHRGLGLLRGRVTRFQDPGISTEIPNSEFQIPQPGLSRTPIRETRNPGSFKIPHMGWNQIEARYSGHPLLAGIPDRSHFYFVHSYHAVAEDEKDVLATCDYGGLFPAVVACANVMGVQFHPEKSQDLGLGLLTNFVKLNRNRLV